MGIFSDVDINSAKISGGKGLPLLPGNYVLTITECKGLQTRNKGPAYEVFFEVSESDNPEQPVGSITNEFCLLQSDFGPGKAKEVLVAASGFDANGLTDAESIKKTDFNKMMALSVTEPALLVGRKLRCMVVKATSKTGKGYDRRQYMYHPEVRAKYVTKTAK